MGVHNICCFPCECHISDHKINRMGNLGLYALVSHTVMRLTNSEKNKIVLRIQIVIPFYT